MRLRIKEIIKEKGLKQKELASCLGLTPTGFNLIVNNKTIPSIDTLDRIAKMLKVPVAMLLDDESPQRFSAIINCNGIAYEATTPEMLRSIAARL